jgi:hypothetical protein
MKTNGIILSIFVLFIVYKMPAQNTDTYSTSVYIGLEPLMWVIGEKGGYIDYSVSEKLILQSYVAYQSWWKNYDEIKEFENTRFSDYILASRGWVFRFSPSYIFSRNEFQFSQVLLKPELTYKHLSYDNKCFYKDSNGIGTQPRQLRSFKSDYFAFHAIFSHRHFDSSYEDVPVEWFIGPGIGIAFEETHQISEGYSGNCTDEVLDIHTKETQFYYSIRFGVRFGVRVFESKK